MTNPINFLIKSNLHWENWKCDYNSHGVLLDPDVWLPAPNNKNVPWGKYMKGVYPISCQDAINNKPKTVLSCTVHNNIIETDGVWTRGKKLFGAGRLRVLASFTGAKGYWPAIWLRNYVPDATPDNWRDDYYEIDICEHFDNKLYFNQTWHYPDSMLKKAEPKRGHSIAKRYGKINEFVCEWDDTHVKVWVNGHLALDVKGKGFPTEYYLILSMQYGWNGYENRNDLPLYMDIYNVEHFIKK